MHNKPPAAPKSKQVQFPLISSARPGTLDLTGFDFDELLAALRVDPPPDNSNQTSRPPWR